MAKANLKEFRKRSKYINEQSHPTLDLIIWNYSQECQFASAWDKYTTMCRGLITDFKGNIVARPFKKFFNWGQDLNVRIPTEMPIISEKMDGSLGIQYYDGKDVFIATRGSFSSDQAIWATKWIQKRFKPINFIAGKTYLWEILYRENRIVVDYGDREELVLLALVDTETGDETWRSVEEEAQRLGVSCRQTLFKVLKDRMTQADLNYIIEGAKDLSGNEEGYVFHWPNENNLRLKIKGKEYLRLHKLLTEFSNISVWECLKEKQDLAKALEDVPDEFFDYVKKTEEELVVKYKEIFVEAEKGFKKVMTLETRKEQALKVMKKFPNVASEIFSMLDGRDPSPVIWKKIRPVYQKPFWKQENEDNT